MIYRSTTGKGVTGTLRYIQGPGRDEDGKMNAPNGRARLIGGDGFGFPLNDENVEIARRLMEQNGRPGMQASGTNPVKKDAMHLSLAWAREHAPDDEEMKEAVSGVMAALGMSTAMHIGYVHDDKGHPHVHVAVSRVDPDGRAYNNYEERLKGMHWARQWETAHDQRTKATDWIHRWGEAVESGDYQRVQDELFKNEAVLRNTKLKLAVGLGGRFGAEGAAFREEFVRDQRLIGLTKHREGKAMAYTTEEIWRQEARTLAAARGVSKQTGFETDDATRKKVADGLTLTDEQRAALDHATADDGLAITSGQAGTGKSRTSKAELAANEAEGRTVHGIAFTHKVTQDMANDGYSARTIASTLRGKNNWKKDDVIKIDEASQVSTDDMQRIMQRARTAGAKVSLTGHSQQFGSIKHGGLFPIMEDQHGAVELKEVMRTKHDDQKKAFNEMAEGNWKGAVETFKKSRSFRWSDTKEEAIGSLVDDYMKDHVEDPKRSRIAIAMANDDVDEINLRIRQKKKELGLIGDDHLVQTDRGPTPFGVGDRAAINETPPKGSPQAALRDEGLFNGTYGTITGIEPVNGKHEVTIALDTNKDEPVKSIKFTAGINKEEGDIGGLGYGDARTTYKTQGATVWNTFRFHDSREQSPGNYVGASRHQNATRMYVPRETTSGYTQLTEQLKQGHTKTSAHSYRVVDEDRAKVDAPEGQPKKKLQFGVSKDDGEVPRISRGDAPADSKRQVDSGHTQRSLDGALDRPEEVTNLETDRPAPRLAPDEPTVPLAPVSEPDRPTYKNILHELFGTGIKSRAEIDRDGGEAQRNLRDRTTATIPGLLPPTAKQIEEHER